MNYKINKETCCKMCGKEIGLEESEGRTPKNPAKPPDDIMKLSFIRMYDGGEFFECSEHNEDVFYFHPYCAEALLPKNHFTWLKGSSA